MYDADVFATKYANVEAKNTISHAKMMINRVAASALTYFGAVTSASFISRCEDIQAYLLQKQRTSIHGVACL